MSSTPAPLEQTKPIWHALAPANALEVLEVNADGLSADEARRRRRRYGANRLPKPPRVGPLVVFVRQFKNPLIYLLVAAAIVSLGIGELRDAAFIAAVLLFNAIIGGFQEYKAETAAEALDKLVERWVIARRNGRRERTPTEALVPGDIVELESGAVVPADIRLLSAQELSIDESLLTGESTPIGKRPEPELDADTALADRLNMLHAGATVQAGRAVGVVVETAGRTAIGRIAEALTGEDVAQPPLVARLERMTKAIAAAFVVLVAVVALGQLLQGAAIRDVFFLAIALAVAAVPEGLPIAITVALAVASHRMAKRNVIVRALPAVEGLGTCALIGSDKTGTLTCNELTVRRVWLPDGSEIDITGEGFLPQGEAQLDGAPPPAQQDRSLGQLATSGALCNEATFEPRDDGYQRLGDSVDLAFLVMADKLGLDRGGLRGEQPQSAAIPFEPERRFAASFRQRDGTMFAYVKGAPETVLPMCQDAGQDATGTDALAVANQMAADGFRVLAVAAGPIPEGAPTDDSALSGLELLGFAGLIDPLRPEAPDAIQRCREAGIRVAMLTGDHPATALSIARELGIARTEQDVVTGTDLQQVSSASDRRNFDDLVENTHVFARLEPIQKLAIVEALERRGYFVAVTGDGANDAPALRAANIGVAMGLSGTDVARGASDLILTDDNFASIVNGVEEGRIAFDNLRKVVLLLLSTGLMEILVFLVTLIAGLPIPLFAVQLLWLNIATQGFQHVALSFERGEPDVLKRRPRSQEQGVFDRPMIEALLISGSYMGLASAVYWWWALGQGWSEIEARSGLLLLMVLLENVHVMNCRSETRSVFSIPLAHNPLVPMAAAGALGLHVAASYWEGTQILLRIVPSSAEVWLSVLPFAASLIVVVECYKVFIRWRNGRNP